jgi:hypothetical protein
MKWRVIDSRSEGATDSVKYTRYLAIHRCRDLVHAYWYSHPGQRIVPDPNNGDTGELHWTYWDQAGNMRAAFGVVRLLIAKRPYRRHPTVRNRRVLRARRLLIAKRRYWRKWTRI